MRKTADVTFRIPKATAVDLSKIATLAGTSISQVVKVILATEVYRATKPEPPK